MIGILAGKHANCKMTSDNGPWPTQPRHSRERVANFTNRRVPSCRRLAFVQCYAGLTMPDTGLTKALMQGEDYLVNVRWPYGSSWMDAMDAERNCDT